MSRDRYTAIKITDLFLVHPHAQCLKISMFHILVKKKGIFPFKWIFLKLEIELLSNIKILNYKYNLKEKPAFS